MNAISIIKPHGGIVAGQPLWYELWTWGTIHIIKDSKTVSFIKKTLEEFEKMREKNPEEYEEDEKYRYLSFKLEEEFGW